MLLLEIYAKRNTYGAINHSRRVLHGICRKSLPWRVPRELFCIAKIKVFQSNRSDFLKVSFNLDGICNWKWIKWFKLFYGCDCPTHYLGFYHFYSQNHISSRTKGDRQVYFSKFTPHLIINIKRVKCNLQLRGTSETLPREYVSFCQLLSRQRNSYPITAVNYDAKHL
jgi:hypothetical protein